jgi:hypothetical protein
MASSALAPPAPTSAEWSREDGVDPHRREIDQWIGKDNQSAGQGQPARGATASIVVLLAH